LPAVANVELPGTRSSISTETEIWIYPFSFHLCLFGFHHIDTIAEGNGLDKSVLLLWTEDHALVANLSEIPPGLLDPEAHPGSVDSPTFDDNKWPWADDGFVSVILCDEVEQPREGAIAHCPLSGRVCILSSNEIRIMDFLAPPA
jgi:hypothetical protein